MKKIKKFDEFFQDRVLEKDEDNSLLRDLAKGQIQKAKVEQI